MYDDPLDPFLPADWRWQRARFLAAKSPGCYTRSLDKWTNSAQRYLRTKKESGDQTSVLVLTRRFPVLHQAIELHECKDTTLRTIVEARLLANDTTANITKLNCIRTAVVAWYEKLFFDVRSRLHCTDWIARMALGGGLCVEPSDRQNDVLLKLFGYLGGPDVVTAMVFGGTVGLPEPVGRNARSFFDSVVKSSVRHKAAIAARTLRLSFDNQPLIIEAYQRMEAMERSVGGSGGAGNEIAVMLDEMLKAMPFRTGANAKLVDSKSGTDYDNCAAELRSSELIEVAVGMETDAHRRIASMKLPAKENQSAMEK